MNPITSPFGLESPPWPVALDGIPIIYEDEEEEDMGEGLFHFGSLHVLFACVSAFLREQWPDLHACANLNCHYLKKPPYPKTGALPYFSADLMIVRPKKRLPRDLRSYTIGKQGPPPLVTLEIMSQGTAKTRDLGVKLSIYRKLGIKEYILVDPIGAFLPEKLLLKRLQPDGTWKDITDLDGGVTSELGFRLIFDDDGELTVLNAVTGKRYVRPTEAEELERQANEAQERATTEAERAEAEAERAQAEAQRAQAETKRARAETKRAQSEAKRADAEAEARRHAEARIRELEEELKRLRQSPAQD